MCFYKNIHFDNKIIDISCEERLNKENISIEDSSKYFEDNKNKIENEIIKIDKLYDKVDNELTKSYEIKHGKLKKEENELKEKLKNEATKIKENLELNVSNLNNILRNCEKILKGIKSLKEQENQLLIRKLNYFSNINKKQKEMNIIFQQLMKNLNISFNGNNLKMKNIIVKEYQYQKIFNSVI